MTNKRRPWWLRLDGVPPGSARLARAQYQRGRDKDRAAGRPTTIGQFYDDEPHRRGSEELKFGESWSDGRDPGCDHDVFWVANTGELVAMRAPRGRPTLSSMPNTDYVALPGLPESELTVEILATLARDRLDRVMDGWAYAMTHGDGLEWIRRRVRDAP